MIALPCFPRNPLLHVFCRFRKSLNPLGSALYERRSPRIMAFFSLPRQLLRGRRLGFALSYVVILRRRFPPTKDLVMAFALASAEHPQLGGSAAFAGLCLVGALLAAPVATPRVARVCLPWHRLLACVPLRCSAGLQAGIAALSPRPLHLVAQTIRTLENPNAGAIIAALDR